MHSLARSKIATSKTWQDWAETKGASVMDAPFSNLILGNL